MLNEAFAKIYNAPSAACNPQLAATMDGKIAAAGGDARWISGRNRRAPSCTGCATELDAVVVGSQP